MSVATPPRIALPNWDRVPALDRLKGTVDDLALGARDQSIKDVTVGSGYDRRIVLPVNPWKMRVLQTAAQNVAAGSWVQVLFDTVSYDGTGSFNTSTSQFTVPVSGYWVLCSQVSITSPSTNGTYSISISTFKNGGIWDNGVGMIYTNNAASSQTLTGVINETVFMNQGDVFDIRVNDTFGVTEPLLVGQNVWSMHLLSA